MKLFLRRYEYLEKTGDMEEVYFILLEEKGKLNAIIWYWLQTFKAMPAIIINTPLWGLVMFKSYLKIAYRNILKNKIYSSINILGFATGLAAFILIALFVQYEFSYDKYHANAEQIYRVVRNKPARSGSDVTKTSVTPAPLAPLLINEFPEVLNATRFTKNNNALISYGNENFREPQIHWAAPETFEIFTFHFIKGDSKTIFNDPYSVVLSESTAKKYFGNADPIGKTITLHGQFDFQVTGIFYDMPDNSHFKMNVIFPYETYFDFLDRPVTSWGGNFSWTYILLQENADYKNLITKFPNMLNVHIYDVYAPEIDDKYKEVLTLQPLTDIHLHSHRNQELEANGDFTGVLLLSSLAILFLIIACINYTNLSTAKAGQRGKEVGMRKVVGAPRSQLIRQFFGESMTMTLLAFLISTVIVLIVLPTFNQFVDRNLTFNPLNNLQLFLGLIFLVIFVGIFAGIYPALMISGFKPISVLRGTFIRTSKGSRLRNILVILQFAITIVFITFTFVVNDQLNYIRNKDVGYNKDHIITLNVIDPNINENIEAVKSELLKYSGIISASTSYKLPNNTDEHMGVYPPEGDPFLIYTNFADFDFVDLYNIEIVKGRNFSREFPSDLNGAFLVNEAAVKAAQWDTPIGQEFEVFCGSGTIVGVMKDYHIRSFHFPIEPAFIMLNPTEVTYLSIKISPSNLQASIQHIESTIKKFAPATPFEYTFFDEVYDATYKNERKLEALFSAFAILAIIVACLGLFGLATFAAENRTKEIGIRKALGASISNIFILLSKEFLKWVLLANIIAWPVAYFCMRGWLDDFAYRIDLGIWVFILSGIIAIGIALVTVSRQSHKAARTNPVDSLKYE
ncbi:ABC transporter permease [Bacteroidota bacterium]